MSDIDSMPGKLDALTVRVDSMDHRLTRLEGHIAENTEMTREIRTIIPVVNDIREAQVAKRWWGKRIKGAGGIAAALTAIGSAVAAAWHVIHKN